MPESLDPKEYWESRLNANFNDRGVGDIGLPESYNHFLYSVRRHVFRRARRLSGVRAETARVIDIGSGTGFYIRNWIDSGVRTLFGCDITQVAVDQLRQKYPNVQFSRVDIGDPEVMLPSGAFDCVSSFDVLFHIVDDRRYRCALRNIASMLTSGGIFLYSDNLVEQSFNVKHQVGRTESMILQSLKDAGLTVEHRIPMFVLMNDPIRSKNRWLRKFFSLVYRTASKSSTMGLIVGEVLYPFEILLTGLMRSGPSTEVLVCRRTTTGEVGRDHADIS